MINFHCPSCDKHYQVADKHGGKTSKCRKCGSLMPIPNFTDELPAAVAPASSEHDQSEASGHASGHESGYDSAYDSGYSSGYEQDDAIEGFDDDAVDLRPIQPPPPAQPAYNPPPARTRQAPPPAAAAEPSAAPEAPVAPTRQSAAASSRSSRRYHGPTYPMLNIVAWVARVVGGLIIAVGLLILVIAVIGAIGMGASSSSSGDPDLAAAGAGAAAFTGIMGVVFALMPILWGVFIMAAGEALLALRDIAMNTGKAVS